MKRVAGWNRVGDNPVADNKDNDAFAILTKTDVLDLVTLLDHAAGIASWPCNGRYFTLRRRLFNTARALSEKGMIEDA